MMTAKERQELKAMKKDLRKLIPRVAYLEAEARANARQWDKEGSYFRDGLRRIKKLERRPIIRVVKPSKKK